MNQSDVKNRANKTNDLHLYAVQHHKNLGDFYGNPYLILRTVQLQCIVLTYYVLRKDYYIDGQNTSLKNCLLWMDFLDHDLL